MSVMIDYLARCVGWVALIGSMCFAVVLVLSWLVDELPKKIRLLGLCRRAVFYYIQSGQYAKDEAKHKKKEPNHD